MSNSLQRMDLMWHQCVSSKALFESQHALLGAAIHEPEHPEPSAVGANEWRLDEMLYVQGHSTDGLHWLNAEALLNARLIGQVSKSVSLHLVQYTNTHLIR